MLDEKKLNEFMGKLMGDAAASLNGLLVYVGDKLGLYKAMATAKGPVTPDQLASKTGTNPRMVREWLAAQVANGYVTFDGESGKFSLPEEHAFALANEESPVFLQGGFQTTVSLYKDEEKVIRAMKTGKGFGWGDHDPAFYQGQDRLNRPVYGHLLVQDWIPGLEGVEVRLNSPKGARVAEIGSGSGFALSLMAKRYPNSSFIGYDTDESSVVRARKVAEAEGLSNLRFELADAVSYPLDDYDLIVFLSSLHDMKDPAGALVHAHASLRGREGTLMIAEAPAGEMLEENINPIGKLLYPVSTLECVPASLDEGGVAWGTLFGESRLGEVVTKSGFTGFRKIGGTPLLSVYEAKAKSLQE